MRRRRTAVVRARSAGYNRRVRPTLVLLVRHGQTPTTGKVLPGQAPGLHLAEEGQRQANAVAARIEKLPKIAAVYASQLERARETAMPIARAHGLSVRVDRDLADGDVGEWTGQKLWQLARKPEWQTVQRHPSGFRFPGGESFIEMQTRVVSALARIVERHRGTTVVAVSHADPIKSAVAHALGIHLDLFQRIMIAPCSVTAIGYHPHGPVVLTVNSVDGNLGWLGGK
jgi:probable phosphomutase (TIGR03848 family)